MILSDKYEIKEEKEQITLLEIVHKDILDEEGNLTGETKEDRKTLGHYSRSVEGRKQAYNRILNCEISGSEKQDIRDILEIVQNMSDQVELFWSKNG